MKCADFANFVESECKAGDVSFGQQESKRVYKLGDITGKGYLDFADFSRFFAPSESSGRGSRTQQANHAPQQMSPLERKTTPPPLSPLERQTTPPPISNSPFERQPSDPKPSTNSTIPTSMRDRRSNNFKPDLTSQEANAPAKGTLEPNLSDLMTPVKASVRTKERKEKETATSPRAKKMKKVDAKAAKLPDVEAFESEFCDRLSTLLSQHVVVSANLQKGLRREATFWKQRLFGVRDAPTVTATPVAPSEVVLLSEKNKLPKL